MRTVAETLSVLDTARREGGHIRRDNPDFIKVWMDLYTSINFYVGVGARTPPHNHMYPFKSTVLVGEMLNVLYEEHRGSRDEGGLYEVHQVRRNPEGNVCMVNAGYRANLHVADINVLRGGTEYDITAQQIHEAFITKPTITYFERFHVEPLPTSEVYFLNGTGPKEQYLSTLSAADEAAAWADIDRMVRELL